ncbi:MAG: ABC-F family ATP-binding cassette domain-containing protein [Clostridia bacterium]|nr:ABC-F family ATP-binding cassette domain-containing protein [Clostridia bacterium]MBQ6857839.1 ABC-F family ATP-binding cassette domain-containing protein [Clostridia bacterium]MBQ7051432.1 ABC-F family ATP-binding cassette domain-containing protein [Clostridia bacterium]
MIVLSAQNIAKSFGVNAVLKDISFTLQQGDRIGLVGVNGCGKSTLMRIIAGLDSPDAGEISMVRGTRIGYLAQQDMVAGGASVWAELESVYEPVFEMEKRLRMLESDMEHAHEDAAQFNRLSSEYDKLMRRFEDADGYAWKSMVSGVLNGLGFKPAQYDQPVDSLSGGEKTRLCLARLLLQKPDLLLLDEPTNHLDMETLSWLENYLAAYRGSVLVISHDRYFLDHVCTGMVEILMGTSEQYSGNYTRYIAQREERFETRIRAYELQQKEIERQQAIIARYRMFNREKSIRAAESREKALERMEKLEKPVDERAIHFQFEARRRTGEDVLFVNEVSKSFGDKHLFSNFSLHVRAGDRIALIGPNGVGKSTLIKLITGDVPADHGDIRFGANVDLGYYDQHMSSLNPAKTVLDEVWDRFPRMEQSDVRGALGMFLFTGDDVFQPIKTLSGGEKGRVALTALMLRKDNLLLLDEPTNHLDMDSREVLENALSGFGGTIITVSHDRYFINRIADRVIEMRADGVTEYMGNYDDYLEKKNRPVEIEVSAGKTKTEIEKEKRREKMNKQALRQLKARAQEAEKAVGAKEAEIAALEEAMSDPDLYLDSKKAADVQKAYQQAQSDLARLYEEWEQAEAALQEEA